jgi:hypothetical protein
MLVRKDLFVHIYVLAQVRLIDLVAPSAPQHSIKAPAK